MKNLDPQLLSAIQGECLNLAYCWLITRLDGLTQGFTSLDVAFSIDGVPYQPWGGFDPGASQISLDPGTIDTQQLKGITDPSTISKEDLLSGLYEYASVRRFLINYQDIPSSLSLDPPKHLELVPGFLGESKLDSLGFEIKVKDELSKLDHQVGTITHKTCQAQRLGDNRCRKDLSAFTYSVAVSAVESNRVFEIDRSFAPKWFDRGRLTFTSGLNVNLSFDVGYYVQNKIILSPSPTPRTISIGDELTIVAGCVRTKYACIIKFQNFGNFVGQPDVPTTDISVETPVS